MTKKLLIFSALFIFSINLLAQNEEEPAKVPRLNKDPETKKILDKISEYAESFNTMRLKFDYEYEDVAKKEKNVKHGIVYIKKEKYKLFLKNTGVEIMYNGKTQAGYSRTLTDDGTVIEEVTYTTPDTSDTDFMNPTKLYSFYESNFYYRTVGNEIVNGKELTVIDFVPEDRNISLSKIRLKVDEAAKQIYSAKSFSKDGKRLTITITEFKPNVKVVDKLFTFDEAANPNCEVIDLRE